MLTFAGSCKHPIPSFFQLSVALLRDACHRRTAAFRWTFPVDVIAFCNYSIRIAHMNVAASASLCYISPILGEAPRKRIFTEFFTSGDMLDIIICANFDVEKLRGFGNTMGQITEFFIEMAGHPYNSAALPRSL